MPQKRTVVAVMTQDNTSDALLAVQASSVYTLSLAAFRYLFPPTSINCMHARMGLTSFQQTSGWGLLQGTVRPNEDYLKAMHRVLADALALPCRIDGLLRIEENTVSAGEPEIRVVFKVTVMSKLCLRVCVARIWLMCASQHQRTLSFPCAAHSLMPAG